MVRFPFIFSFTKTCSSLWRFGLSACRPGTSVSLHAWRPGGWRCDGRPLPFGFAVFISVRVSRGANFMPPVRLLSRRRYGRDTLSAWNLTPVATSQDMLLISKKKKILLLHVYHLCACSRLAGTGCIVSNYEKLPFNLNPGCLFKYSPLFSI